MSHFLVAGDPETWSLPSESVVQVDLRPGDPEPRRPETRRSGSLSDEGLRGMGSHWASNSSEEADFELSFKTSRTLLPSIAQGNPELKEKGILGLAGFLDKVISMVGFGMLFLAAIPVGCYSALGTLRDIQDLEPQLKQFDVERSECFCCSNDHRHPDTGQKLRCDRRLVFHTLKGWYGEAGDSADEHLKRFNSTVQTSLRDKVLEGADSVIFPIRVVACMFFAVFLFPYALVKLCKLGLPLMAKMSLASRMPYTLLQRAGYVDLWPWLTLAWLLLAISLMRGCRCKSK
ncbi:Mal-A2 [Symbiodinium microadriaticum]|nr:Mal-A2 [Symbiodinium microadriaticum]